MLSGGALSDMDTEENPSNFFNVDEGGFPFVLKAMNNERHEIGSWTELSAFLDSRPSGVSELAFLRRYGVEGYGKPISFMSLLSPLVVPYLAAYMMATSKYVHGYLYDGSFQDQPAVLMEAFALISGETAKYEQERIRLMKRQQAESSKRG